MDFFSGSWNDKHGDDAENRAQGHQKIQGLYGTLQGSTGLYRALRVVQDLLIIDFSQLVHSFEQASREALATDAPVRFPSWGR